MVKMQDDFKTIVELLSWTLSRVSLAPIPSLMLDLAVLLTYPIGLFKSYNPVVEYVVINNIDYSVCTEPGKLIQNSLLGSGLSILLTSYALHWIQRWMGYSACISLYSREVVIAGSLPGGLCCETRRTHVSGAWAAEGLRRMGSVGLPCVRKRVKPVSKGLMSRELWGRSK